MPRLIVPVTERDHVRGPARAGVTLVEYGDFQCPYCGMGYWVLKAVEHRFQRDLRFVFRNFPLTEIHPLAMIAAEAAEAAAAQGKFWEMHDQLFENQPELEPDQLVAYAGELDLELETFTEELAGHRHRRRIQDDFMGGVRSGVNGTPCLFINGQRYDGPVEETALIMAIDEARGERYVETR